MQSQSNQALVSTRNRWTLDADSTVKLLSMLDDASRKVITIPMRLSWLRMYKQYEIDDWRRNLLYHKPKPSREKQCTVCGTGDPLHYPHGMLGGAFCPEHHTYTNHDFLDGELAERAKTEASTKAIPDIVKHQTIQVMTHYKYSNIDSHLHT